jgi:hypothetical protein
VKKAHLAGRVLLVVSALGVAGVLAFGGIRSVGTQKAGAAELGLTKVQLRLLSGFASTELTSGESSGGAVHLRNYEPKANGDCPTNLASNIKVNQNCLNLTDPNLQGRGQAENETSIAQDPTGSSAMVASYNDYRRGDGTCGVSYSSNGGQSWTDATLPNGFVAGAAFGAAREYFQASGDGSVAWDTKGNAYYDCQMFDRGPGTTTSPDFSSGVYVFRSTGNGGASWNFVGRPAVQQSTTAFVPLLDKPYMTVDAHAGSPFQDRIYVTWTLFAADGSAYIYEAYSSDYGETFSSPVLVSGNSSSLCTNTFGVPTSHGNCNENQDSDPFTGPDGALYVAFNNYNNTVSGSDNRNQVLLAKSTDGGQTFSAPVKVGDFYDLPDCATYQGGQDAGRACVPEKGSSQNSIFRANNYPSGGVNPAKPNQIAVTFGSYINPNSNESNGCTPTGFAASGQNVYTGVKTAGACNNDILLSVSNDAGATFTGGTTDPRSLTSATGASGQTSTDQWWQWAAFSSSGTLAVSYYDRQYGNDETTGSMDMSLSSSSDLSSFKSKQVTSSSMPLPTEFPDSLGNSTFFGDYTGLSVAQTANPIWMDTRSLDLFACPSTSPPALCTGIEPNGLTANDQDIFTSSVGLPR